MHPARWIIAGILLGGLLVPSRVRGELDPTVSLSASHVFGCTRYAISFPYRDDGSESTGRSDLEFPLDVFLGGFQISLGENPARRNRLSLIGALRRNVNNPATAMTDSDWVGSRRVGYSESGAALTAWQAALGCRIRIARRERIALSAEVGYRFSSFSYKIYGLEGWYEGEWFGGDAGRQVVILDAGLHVLNYRVRHHLPLAGLVAEFHPAGWLEMEIGVHVSPYAYAVDHDDHILRKKDARGSGSGFATLLGVNVQANLPSTHTTHEFFFELRLEWTKIDTDGEQTQHWYGDDPLTAGMDDTGARVEGIDDEISASLGRAEARAGWRF